jgi:tRNA A-37 threonylcarbamoyl transferase component Bud32
MSVERLAHGYSNGTRLVDGIVEKRHLGPSRHIAAKREANFLQSVAESFPVPRVLAYDPAEPLLCLERIEGENGQALVERGLDTEVLLLCGMFLKRIGTIDVSGLDFLENEGPCLVHGDYGPQNLLMSHDATEVRGIVDWEWVPPWEPA